MSEGSAKTLAYASGSDKAVSHVVLAAGRLSPEKGFGVLVEAAAEICRDHSGSGVVLFGEGALRAELENRVAALGLAGRVVMPGFRTDLDSLIGAADVVVLPSFTEGCRTSRWRPARGRAVVATAVAERPRSSATAHRLPRSAWPARGDCREGRRTPARPRPRAIRNRREGVHAVHVHV